MSLHRSDSENEDGWRVNLIEPISRSALMMGEDVTFTVTNGQNRDEVLLADQPEDVFDPDTLLRNVNLEVLGAPDESALGAFESIKLTMINVTEDRTVLKRIIHKGYGDRIDPKSEVTIHYNGYLEHKEVPFDSSHLRGKAETHQLGREGLIKGLYLAIRSMRVGEEADYILHPSVAYGKFGCPPRIDGDVEVLFNVQLLKARAGVDANTEIALYREDKPSWDKVQEVVKKFVSDGVESFRSGKFRDSKTHLENARRDLLRCHLKDENEEDSQKKALLTVYTNLALVYNKMGDHDPRNARNAILYCKEGLFIDENKHKLHLQWGIALINLGDYELARQHLQTAKKACPDALDVSVAWERLNEKLKREREIERAMWQRVFGHNVPGKEEEMKKDTCPEHDILVKTFEGLRRDSKKEVVLPKNGLTQRELDNIQELAHQFGFQAVSKDSSCIIVRKRN